MNAIARKSETQRWGTRIVVAVVELVMNKIAYFRAQGHLYFDTSLVTPR
jgi:hypothetical protein